MNKVTNNQKESKQTTATKPTTHESEKQHNTTKLKTKTKTKQTTSNITWAKTELLFDAALVAAIFDQKTENPFQNPKNLNAQIQESPEKGLDDEKQGEGLG